MPYLTPDEPTRLVAVLVQVPDTMMPHFVGALLDLWDWDHWEYFGPSAIDDTIDRVAAMIESIQEDYSPPMAAFKGLKKRAYDANEGIYFTGTSAIIPFNNSVFNYGFSDNGQGVFTLQASGGGFYSIRCNVSLYSEADNVEVFLYIKVNNAYLDDQVVASKLVSGETRPLQISALTRLFDGDAVSIWGRVAGVSFALYSAMIDLVKVGEA